MRINLTSGSIPARSVVESSQRRLNVYLEKTPQDSGEPGSVTHLPTPGLRLLGVTPNGLPLRGLHRASNGDLYGVAGNDMYYIDSTWTFNAVGSLTDVPMGSLVLPIKMIDNGVSLCLCDGLLADGWSVNLKTRTGLTPLLNPAAGDALTTSSTGWLGSTFLDVSDTFLIANYIGTPSMFISNSQDVIFDALQFVSKTSYPDILIAAVVSHRLVWLIGALTTEVFYNTGGTGGSNFPFAAMPGVSVGQGCVAPYSICKAGQVIFWLGQSSNGGYVVVKTSDYSVERVSTNAVEDVFAGYAATSSITDCIAYSHLLDGHAFVVMNFPKADATWVYDMHSSEWHERCYADSNGEHMQRSTMHAYAYGTDVVNDWQNGNVYALDAKAYTDNGASIKRMVSFPRMISGDDDYRMRFDSFTAEMACGETLDLAEKPQITLRWSDDKGRTFGNGVMQPLGRSGEYSSAVSWNRLGLSRQRVFRLEWTVDGDVALQAAYVNAVKAAS